MQKHDEQRREAVAGMRDRWAERERAETIRVFGPRATHVFRGTPADVLAQFEEWTCDVPGVGAEYLDVVDGRVVRG